MAQNQEVSITVAITQNCVINYIQLIWKTLHSCEKPLEH